MLSWTLVLDAERRTEIFTRRALLSGEAQGHGSQPAQLNPKAKFKGLRGKAVSQTSNHVLRGPHSLHLKKQAAEGPELFPLLGVVCVWLEAGV